MLKKLLNNFNKTNINSFKYYATKLNDTYYENNYLEENDIQQKVLKVAMIGTPNSGKSTLINNLMDRKVCATSSKVHTTRTKAKAIFTEADTQIIFLDTPGLVNIKDTKRFNLEKSFIKDSKSSLHETDMIGVIHDASNVYTRSKLDIKVIKLLEQYKKKESFLVLNKVDTLKSKRILLDITKTLTGSYLDGKPMPNLPPIKETDEEVQSWPHFSNIFMVSALHGHGLEDIRYYLLENAKEGKWLFPADTWSDQSMELIILNTVKAKFLNFLNQELPYRLKPEIELLEINEKGVVHTMVNVYCPSERIATLIAGANNGRLKQIIEGVQGDLQDAFKTFVRIDIILKAQGNK